MTFDATTITVTAATLGFVMGSVQWMAWLHLRNETSLAVWSGANVASAIGLVILVLPGVHLPISPYANFWFLLSTGLTYIGMRSFDRAPNSPALVIFTVLMAAFAAWLTLVWIDMPVARRTVFSLATVGWMGAAAWRLSRTPPTGPAFSRMAVSLFLSIFCAMHLARLATAATGILPFFNAPDQEQLAVTLLISLVCGVGLNYGALFMVLDRLASSDELTGLNNRRALLRRGQTLLDRTLAQGQPLTVLLVDLDHFKQVNDRFGHRVGDLVLETFARVATGNLRSGDVMGRYGGEEFCIVLPRSGQTEATAAAERLRLLCEERLAVVDGCETRVTVAIGLASLEAGASAPRVIHTLIDAADHALYAAKDGGRNRVVAAPAQRVGQTEAALDAEVQPSPLH